MPRYAPTLARISWLIKLREQIPGLAHLVQAISGISAKRSLPVWRDDYFAGQSEVPDGADGPEVVLLADTFNTWFEPENLRAAIKVFAAANYRTVVAEAPRGQRPLCCGRTYLASGMIDEARNEAQRLLEAVTSYVERGVPVVGLEPSCILGLRDEFRSLLPGPETDALAELALTFEEFVVREHAAGRFQLDLQALSSGPRTGARPLPSKSLWCHARCSRRTQHDPETHGRKHRVRLLRHGRRVRVSKSKHAGISQQMAEASLLPAVREASDDVVIVADGTSCRHQIKDGSGREAIHVARVLADALGY